MASSKETYCLCGQPYNIGQFMIECDCCREWFHGSCVNVKIYQSDDIDKYHCPKCSTTYGPSVLKQPTNNHRADRYEIGAEARAAQVGSPAWVRALSARPLRPHPQSMQRMKGYQFTEEFIRDNGFTRPVLVDNPDGLEMMTPDPNMFNARSVLRYCGTQLEVEVIDVRKQSSFRMPLGEFVEYFESPPEGRDEKVLNVLSLEFSDTDMSVLVEPPHTVRKLDWAARVWPASEARPCRPAVQKYCLMSAGGAYTDWHVDFGGTHVWYRVMRGGKIFYLAPPTPTNLALYQQWSSANNQNEKFFGDMIEWYGTVELNAGETLFIPSGWIHAVYTPRDSLVFGGNWLHSYAIDMQLQIYEIERRVETPMNYRYPLFEPINWYAGSHLLSILRRYNEESQDEDFTIGDSDPLPAPAEIPPLMLKGIKTLTDTLKQWHALKTSDSAKRDNVPKSINSGQLVRELSKELRLLEKRTTSAANKDKDFKPKNSTSPNKSHSKKQNQKKSIKLTLPKPIMHMAQNGQYVDEKIPKDNNIVYDNKSYIEKDIYQEQAYIAQDIKYVTNHLEEAKTFTVDGKEIIIDKNYMYQGFEEQLPSYVDTNGFVDKKNDNILRLKMNNSPSSSRAPPPYPDSILKSHLTSPNIAQHQPANNRQQWTISKKDIGEYHHQILYTNDQLQTSDIAYQGMYAPEEIAEPYGYDKQYQYAYTVDPYAPQDTPQLPPVHQQPAATYGPTSASHNNGYHEPLPSYDAAIAHHYNAHTATVDNTYQTVDVKPSVITTTTSPGVVVNAVTSTAAAPAAAPEVSTTSGGTANRAVRRSQRGPRRRVSPSYDYGDSDSDSTPPPNLPPYRNRARPAPVNGIESLIQASELADDAHTENAAVAGMLSIGTGYPSSAGTASGQHQPSTTFGLAHSAKPEKSGSSRKRTKVELEEDVTAEDIIKEVHRDDEYVYPALDMSSDEEEEEWSSRRRNPRARHDSRTKADKDGSWAPRGRLGRLVPRSRPARHTRRESVRAALLAARDRPHHRPVVAKRPVVPVKVKRPPVTPPETAANKNNARLKKGMKTAKQRLGKILKLHKMMY